VPSHRRRADVRHSVTDLYTATGTYASCVHGGGARRAAAQPTALLPGLQAGHGHRVRVVTQAFVSQLVPDLAVLVDLLSHHEQPFPVNGPGLAFGRWGHGLGQADQPELEQAAAAVLITVTEEAEGVGG
jgi:hypothetical protein